MGEIDDPKTYQRLRVERAALVVATNRDEINTNIAFTVRELSEQVRILTTAELAYSDDILKMAGSTRVFGSTTFSGAPWPRGPWAATARPTSSAASTS